ncbi:hypothetical protein COW57_01805 [Candidatus Roizmanbacteria bacterium CG17_big_fil_post_rev_8_21_14_2_50_39_7]|uniref:Uncharacterized protein n=2 Tax=Candidatus Roizmaniibacteriota TaxID=1752723 RepID=A0A2M7EKF1_9BACT|nr:MAG: hypothetical protein COS52_04330 [Candidatus Roizmanbacteria bacterium CG03_land_8_20_14_0_80_39_12]PIV71047.1 MAG: hypothetical protein COW57_01805 [Candidatus Roizmanbacteria bacterium CG17_big_fil_post_rev_8_21_14_2_50_39_7]
MLIYDKIEFNVPDRLPAEALAKAGSNGHAKFFDFRDRLMVGPQTLNLSIYVRVVVSEQKTLAGAVGLAYSESEYLGSNPSPRTHFDFKL